MFWTRKSESVSGREAFEAVRAQRAARGQAAAATVEATPDAESGESGELAAEPSAAEPRAERATAEPDGAGPSAPAEALPAGRSPRAKLQALAEDSAEGKAPLAPAAVTPPSSAAKPAAKSAQGAKALVQAKGRKLNLVDNDTLFPAIREAVLSVLGKHAADTSEDLRTTIADGVRVALVETLRSRSKRIRGLPEQAFLKKVKAERDRIVGEREKAEAQLTQLLMELEAKRNDLYVRSQMIASESAAAGAMHDRLIAEQLREAFAQAGNDPAALLAKVTAIALQSVDGERQKVVDAKVAEHEEEIANFERRISKLTQSLQMTEEEMRRIAAAKGIEIGISSLYRSVQGLSAVDTNFETKKELMATIFQANLDLKQAIEAALPG